MEEEEEVPVLVGQVAVQGDQEDPEDPEGAGAPDLASWNDAG